MLGNNNLRDEYKTSGYAFFDNIRLTTVKDDTVLPTENVKTITLSVPNGSFDYKTTSDYPYLYNRVTTTDTNSNYGLVNEVDAKDGKITLVNEYAVDAAAVKDHGSVFAIYNVADARMGFYTTNPLYFKRGGYYKVTVSLNTKYVESGKAYLALGKSKDLSDNTVIEIAQKTAKTTAGTNIPSTFTQTRIPRTNCTSTSVSVKTATTKQKVISLSTTLKSKKPTTPRNPTRPTSPTTVSNRQTINSPTLSSTRAAPTSTAFP